MPFPTIPNLPEILKHHKEHLLDCGICYRTAVRIKGTTPKIQLDLITQIINMHGEESIKPRLLGRDKMIYLKIPERLWEDIVQLAAEHKIRIGLYEIKSFTFTKAENIHDAPINKARELAQSLKPDNTEIASPDLSRIFAPFKTHASESKVETSTPERKTLPPAENT